MTTRRRPVLNHGDTVDCRGCRTPMVVTKPIGHTLRYECAGCTRARRREDRLSGKDKARQIVLKAVTSGQLQRLPCAKCGAAKTEGHHTDYSRPLDVQWLCRACHAAERRGVKVRSGVTRVPIPPPTEAERKEQMRAALAARWGVERTHCRHGHEYTVSNTTLRVRGQKRWRECKTCSSATKRRFEARARAKRS